MNQEQKEQFLYELTNGNIKMEYKGEYDDDWKNAKNLPNSIKETIMNSYFDTNGNGFLLRNRKNQQETQFQYLPNSPKFTKPKINLKIKGVNFVSNAGKWAIIALGNTYSIKIKLQSLGFYWTKINVNDLPEKAWVMRSKDFQDFFEKTNITWEDILDMGAYKELQNISKNTETKQSQKIDKNPEPLPQNYANFDLFKDAIAYYIATKNKTEAKADKQHNDSYKGSTSTFKKYDQKRHFEYDLQWHRSEPNYAKSIWTKYLTQKLKNLITHLK